MISEKDFQLPVSSPPVQNPRLEYFKVAKKRAVAAFEKDYLVTLLMEQRGDMVRAAKKAGKSRTALWNLLKKHSLSPKQFRG